MLLVAGCGGGGAARSGRLGDLSQKPPSVNALDVGPATGDSLMTTNCGLLRIDARTHTVARVRATVTANRQSAGVGTFLDVLWTGPGRLLGAGQPDYRAEKDGTIVATQDGGRPWKTTLRP